MKHEPVRLLLKALHGVYARQKTLTPRERGEVVADVLEDYADRTGGRDGLKDIASIPATLDEPDLTKADTRHALAMTIFEGKAEALRQIRPVAQQISGFRQGLHRPGQRRTSEDPTRRKRGTILRNRRPSRTDPITRKADLAIAKRDNAIVELRGLADELRKRHPGLTLSQAFAKVYQDPANAKLAAAERQSAREALYA